MKKLGLLPAICLLGWFAITTFQDITQNKRLDALEHATVTVENVLRPVVIPRSDGLTEVHSLAATNITVGLTIQREAK